MKRVLVFITASFAFVGLLAGPAAAAGGLKKFNVDDTGGVVYPGYAQVSGVLLCNPSTTGPVGYRITVTVTQGSTTGVGQTSAPCSGQTEHWQTQLEQDGPFFPGRARVCASAAKYYNYTSTGDRASSTICESIKLIEYSAP